MTQLTIDTEIFKQRLRLNLENYPSLLPDKNVASELDASLIKFAETIKPGTQVKRLPRLILDSGLFTFDTWAKIIGGNSRVVKNDLKKLVLQRIAQALSPQNIRGEYGREATFS